MTCQMVAKWATYAVFCEDNGNSANIAVRFRCPVVCGTCVVDRPHPPPPPPPALHGMLHNALHTSERGRERVREGERG